VGDVSLQTLGQGRKGQGGVNRKTARHLQGDLFEIKTEGDRKAVNREREGGFSHHKECRG